MVTDKIAAEHVLVEMREARSLLLDAEQRGHPDVADYYRMRFVKAFDKLTDLGYFDDDDVLLY